MSASRPPSKKTVRVSIALEDELLRKFDQHVQRRKYSTRSEAMRDLIRAGLVEQQWSKDRVVVGTITLLYDHHTRDLTRILTHLQHQSRAKVLSSLHVHLDHHYCLEVIAVKGRSPLVRELADTLIGTRGVLHGNLTATALGQAV